MSKVNSTERHDTERTQCGAKPSISISQHEARQGGPTDHQILCTLGFFLLRCYLGECYVFLFCCVTRACLISHRTTPVREGSRISCKLRGTEAQSATHVIEVDARRPMPPGHKDRRTASTPAKAAATANTIAK